MRSLQKDIDEGYCQIKNRCLEYIRSLENPDQFDGLVNHLNGFNGDLNCLNLDVLKDAFSTVEKAKQWKEIIGDPIEKARTLVSTYRGFNTAQEFLKHHNAIICETDWDTYINDENGCFRVYMRRKGRKIMSLILNTHELCHLDDSFKQGIHFKREIDSDMNLRIFLKSTHKNFLQPRDTLLRLGKISKNNAVDVFNIICMSRNPLHLFDDPIIIKKAANRCRKVENIYEIKQNRLKWDVLGWISEGVAYGKIENVIAHYKHFTREEKLHLQIFTTLNNLGTAFTGLNCTDLSNKLTGITIEGLCYNPKYHVGIGFVEFWKNSERSFLDKLIAEPKNILDIFGKKYDIDEITDIQKSLKIHWKEC